MSNRTSFVKQAAILAMASILVRFIGFLYRLPLTSLLGDQGNGVYGKAYTIYTFLLILSSAGLPAAISKMVSERAARREAANAHRVFVVSLAVSGVLGLIAALILGFGAGWLAEYVDTPGSKYAILTLAPTVFIVGIMSSFRGYFQGLKNTVPTAISQVIEQLFNAVFSVYLAYILLSAYGVEAAAAGGTAGTGIGALAGLAAVALIYFVRRPSRQRLRGRTESNARIARELIMTALPIITGTAILSITNIIDMKMVSSCLSRAGSFSPERIDELFGQLSGKYVVLVTLPVSIATALSTAVVPNIAATNISRDRASLHSKINIALKLTMLISIPSAMGMGVLAQPILRMLFPRHHEGASLLTVGAVSIIFLALAQISTGILQGIGRVSVPAIAAFAGGIIKIPINYWLISDPRINIHGAVISTIACYAVAASIDLFVLVRATDLRLMYSDIFIKPLLAAAVMGVSCYVFYNFTYLMLPSNTLACLTAVLLSVVVYFIYLLIMRGLTADDLKYVPAGDKFTTLCRRIGLPI